jgi:hypothetical protein
MAGFFPQEDQAFPAQKIQSQRARNAASTPSAPSERFGEKVGYTAACPCIAAAQPGVKDALSLSQYCQKRLVRFAPRTAGIIYLSSALLLPAALENGGIQIQTEPFNWRLKHRQQPLPERAPKSLDGALRKAQKQIAHGIGAWKRINPQHGVKSFVRAQPLGVRKTTGVRDHRTQKCHEGVSGRDGIRRRMRKRHGLAELWSETYFVKKLQKDYQATKGRDSSGSTTQKDWLFGQWG